MFEAFAWGKGYAVSFLPFGFNWDTTIPTIIGQYTDEHQAIEAAQTLQYVFENLG